MVLLDNYISVCLALPVHPYHSFNAFNTKTKERIYISSFMVTTYQVDILGILNLQNHIKRHHVINIRTVLKYNSCETIVH